MSSEPEEVRRQFGLGVRAWRTHRGLSVRALAAQAGIKSPHLSRIETGKALPSIPVLLALSAALDVHPGVLLVWGTGRLTIASLMASAAEALQKPLPQR